MNLLSSFNLRSAKLFNKEDAMVLAISGGVDSVVLCDLLYEAGYKFMLAHCNFQLRSEESERDEQFIRDLTMQYGLELMVKRFATADYAHENKMSIQVAARELRYQWFHDILQNTSLRGQPLKYIITAHHGDDNIETVLMNFFRGTGINGLKGIQPKQEKIIRPLLHFRKDELLEYATEKKLRWVEDSSNQSDKYSRNYFRNQFIPLIQKIFPEAEKNLYKNIGRFTEIGMLYDQAINQHKKKLLEYKGNEIHIPVLKLRKVLPLRSIIHEIIKEYGFSSGQIDDVIELLSSDSGKFVQSGNYRILKNRNWLIIAPKNDPGLQHILIEENDIHVLFTQGSLSLEKIDAGTEIDTSRFIAYLDAEQVSFPLLLRRWKHGDYFYPLGMKKKKKLARFFIDQKVSVSDKEKSWVIETNKKIVWVTGRRIDDRFKINDQTRQILKIAYNPA